MNFGIKIVILGWFVLSSISLTAQSNRLDNELDLTCLQVDSLPAGNLTKGKHNLIKLSLLSFVGSISVFYERGLSPHTSLVLGYGLSANRVPNYSNSIIPGGFAFQRATLEVRRYLAANELTGFYAGAYLRLSELTARRSIKDSFGANLELDQRGFIWIPGLLVGRQFISKWFCLDSFVGIQRQILVGPSLGRNEVVEAMTAPWGIRLGLTVGVAF